MNSISERLRSIRLEMGMSQANFGKMGGVSTKSQVLYEKGERFPDTRYLENIAANGVDICKLLVDSPQGNHNPYLQTREETTQHVTEIVERVLAAFGEKFSELQPSKKRALIEAAYKFHMSEDDLRWYYKNSHLICGVVVFEEKELNH